MNGMNGHSFKVLWKGHILPGMKDEYIRRHNTIWPEMVEDLKKQGIVNYSIFSSGDEIIGYYECDDMEKLRRVKSESETAKRWSKSMEGIVEFEKEPDGKTNKVFEQIFYLE